MYNNYRVKAILARNVSKSGKTYFQVAIEPYDLDTLKTLPCGITVMFDEPQVGDEVVPRVRLDLSTNKFVFGGFATV